MASGRVHNASLLWPASLALLLVSCHVDLSGLNQLFSSDPTYLSLPGTRIGSGKFSKVSIVGNNASGARVIAFDGSGTSPVLTLFPFSGHGKSCSTAPAFQYRALDFGVRSTIPAIVGYHEKSGKDALLHLTTIDCEETIAPIKDGSFPIDQTMDAPPGYLAVDGDANLTFLDPFRKKTSIAAGDVNGTRIVKEKVWSIEGSELVVRDMHLKELARYGKSVTEFDVANNGTVDVMYVEGVCGEQNAPCPGDLMHVTDALGTPEKIDSDACSVIYPVRWGGLGVSYRSPCEEGRLVVYGSTSRGAQPSKTVIGDGVLGSPDVDFMGSTQYAFYVKPDASGTRTLYGGVLGKDAEAIAQGVTRDSGRGAPIIDKAGSAWRMTVDYDSSKHVGRLVTWSPGKGVDEIATGLRQLSGPVAIVNFDGSVGDLVELKGATVSKPLAHRVPPQHILIDDPGIALVADYDGNRGTLLVAPAGTVDFEEVSKGITVAELDPNNGGVAFLHSLGAIGYLHDFDPQNDVGILGARIIETGDTFDIGIRASEWSEFGWPEPGILYVAPEGDAAGIWFARLR